jgi:predicted phosphoadenosine phosphosulfate sulfurtransferase
MLASTVTIGESVFDNSIQRIKSLYEDGHRVIVSFSAGKDSGVCLELAIVAARETGNLPVEVVMRDEEIMFPGTFEYAERVYHRKEVNMHWVVANQPIINIFNRECPYWWVFDPLLKPEQWVRIPPAFAEYIKTLSIESMTNSERFPPAKGKCTVQIIGLRTSESMRRKWAIKSMKGSFKTHVMGKGQNNMKAHPIYDWSDHDIWKAISDNKWDYNHAYDVMFRLGMSPSRLRIAPPTMVKASAVGLKVAMKAWPRWFDKVCTRLPGIRAIARYGVSVLQPHRLLNESWEECFKRECITHAPKWIAERSTIMMDTMLRFHSHHSQSPFPQVSPCPSCYSPGSWKDLAMIMYCGSPFCSTGGQTKSILKEVDPEMFRAGSGRWEGNPTW